MTSVSRSTQRNLAPSRREISDPPAYPTRFKNGSGCRRPPRLSNQESPSAFIGRSAQYGTTTAHELHLIAPSLALWMCPNWRPETTVFARAALKRHWVNRGERLVRPHSRPPREWRTRTRGECLVRGSCAAAPDPRGDGSYGPFALVAKLKPDGSLVRISVTRYRRVE